MIKDAVTRAGVPTVAIVLCGCLSIAHAQTATRNTMNAYNNANITANGRGAITGPIVNGMFGQLINGMGVLNDSNIWSGSNTFTGAIPNLPSVIGQLPVCTPGSSVAPVPTGQAFQCAGVILIAQ